VPTKTFSCIFEAATFSANNFAGSAAELDNRKFFKNGIVVKMSGQMTFRTQSKREVETLLTQTPGNFLHGRQYYCLPFSPK